MAFILFEKRWKLCAACFVPCIISLLRKKDKKKKKETVCRGFISGNGIYNTRTEEREATWVFFMQTHTATILVTIF